MTKLVVILVIGGTFFALLAPVLSLSTTDMVAAQIRDECFGAGSTTQVTIYTSIIFFVFNNFGTVFLPKGVPYPTDGPVFYFEPFGPNRLLECG